MGGWKEAGTDLSQDIYSKPYFNLLPLSVLHWRLIHQEQPWWYLWNSDCLGKLNKGWKLAESGVPSTVKMWIYGVRDPQSLPIMASHGAACAPWCRRRKRLLFSHCWTLPSCYHSSVQLWQRSRPSSLCSWLRNQFLYCSVKQCRAAVLYFLHMLCWGPWQWIKAQHEPSAFASTWCGECGPIPMTSRGVAFTLWKINCFYLLSHLPCPSSSHCNHSVAPTSYLRTGRGKWERWGGCCCLTQPRGVAAGHEGVEEPEKVTQVLPGAFQEVLPAMVSRKLSSFCSSVSSWWRCRASISWVTQIDTTILRAEGFFCKMLRELQEGEKLLKTGWI